MRLVSFIHSETLRFVEVREGVVCDLTGHGGHRLLESMLRAGDVDRLRGAKAVAALHLDDVTLLPPVSQTRAVFCIGVNYAHRDEDYGEGEPTPSYPNLFLRMPESLTGHGSPIERPFVSEQSDYEGEIAIVIGREGRHIAREDALSHVVGLTLANEGSVRDWLRHSKFNVTQGKNFDHSGSIGPWIVTSDEVDPGGPLRITTRVNGELRQDDMTERMIFPFDRLIAYLSTFATLKPGDVILTGTPTGAGARHVPPKWLVPGDVVEVAVEGLGVLRNEVVDEMRAGSGVRS